MTDDASPALRHLKTGILAVIDGFQAMGGAAAGAVPTAAFDKARASLTAMDTAMDGVSSGIQSANAQQQRFNSSIGAGQRQAMSLKDAFLKVSSVIAALAGGKKLLDLSDKMTNTTARLNLLVDDGGSVLELENKIRASAKRARASYTDTAAAIAKMGMNAGHAFAGNDELIRFTELVNKQFAVGGASAQEQSSAMLQLTQAMGAGALRGEELNSILEGAPGIARAIERYMGAAQGSIKKFAEDGLVTAEVVKNALFMAADDINGKFGSMPKTWAQVWTDFKDRATQAFGPVLQRINDMANSPQLQNFVDKVVQGVSVASNVCLKLMDLVSQVATTIAENWGWIGPIVGGVTAAILAYNIAMGVAKAVTAAAAVISSVKAAADAMQAGATFAATAAQYGLNAALLACPITWIVMGIMLLIVALYAGVAAFNSLSGASVSATGIIFGAFSALGAFLWNLFLGFLDLVLGVIQYLVNPFIQFGNFLANIFVNPISSIIYLFQGLADNVLAILESIARAIDSVFGSNLAGAVSGWRVGLKGAADDLVKKMAPEENYKEIIPQLDFNTEKFGLKRMAYGDAFNGGYGAGANFENGIKDLFSGFNNMPGTSIPGGMDNPYTGGYTPYDELGGPLKDIEKNTGRTADALEISEEDLKYMRDLAEREAVNRYTTAEIKLDFTMQSEINSDLDLDGVADYVGAKVMEASQMAAEGVHK